MVEVEFDPGALEADVVEELAEVLMGTDGLAQQSIDRSHARLREYADDYDVEPVIESLVVPRAGPAFQPDEREIDLRWEWTHPAAEYFNSGTSDHTIHGDDVLSFIWEDAPRSVRDMFPGTERQDGDPRVFFQNVTVTGISETQFVAHGTEWLQRELARRFA